MQPSEIALLKNSYGYTETFLNIMLKLNTHTNPYYMNCRLFIEKNICKDMHQNKMLHGFSMWWKCKWFEFSDISTSVFSNVFTIFSLWTNEWMNEQMNSPMRILRTIPLWPYPYRFWLERARRFFCPQYHLLTCHTVSIMALGYNTIAAPVKLPLIFMEGWHLSTTS